LLLNISIFLVNKTAQFVRPQKSAYYDSSFTLILGVGVYQFHNN